MLFDSHVHSVASPDSEMPPQDAIAEMQKKGLGIAFTEHVDFDEKEEGGDAFFSDAPRYIDGFFYAQNYPTAYKKFRGEGVTLGLEIGLSKAFAKKNAALAASFDYDFIIGSVHCVDGADIYYACDGKTPQEAFTRRITSRDENEVRLAISQYLTYSREVVEHNAFFDAFGHIDYIARILPFVSKIFSYENFSQEFDSLLKAIAEREIALEINTCLFATLPAEKYLKIYSRFAELGGRFCTIGSDAHAVFQLARHMDDAKKIAEATGLSVVYYKERKPIRCE
jgi:histidinol-phosphatase (PHP family)